MWESQDYSCQAETFTCTALCLAELLWQCVWSWRHSAWTGLRLDLSCLLKVVSWDQGLCKFTQEFCWCCLMRVLKQQGCSAAMLQCTHRSWCVYWLFLLIVLKSVRQMVELFCWRERWGLDASPQYCNIRIRNGTPLNLLSTCIHFVLAANINQNTWGSGLTSPLRKQYRTATTNPWGKEKTGF